MNAQAFNLRDRYEQTREIPMNIEAEQAMLGALMMNNSGRAHIPTSFSADHFSQAFHQELFEAFDRGIKAGRSMNPVTIRSFLSPAFQEQKVGELTVAQYLARLVSEAATIGMVKEYAEAITDYHFKRVVIEAGAAAEVAGFNSKDELEFTDRITGIRDRLNETLAAIARRNEPEESFFDAIDITDHFTADAMTGRQPLGLYPGLPEIEHLIGGYQKGQLIIIGGGVKQGKGQPLDAKILTPFGYRRMGDMSVGSQVTAPDGTVAKVLQIHKLGIRQLFDVRFSDGTSCEVTDDHIWLARRAERTAKRSGAVVSGDQAMRKYTTTEMMELMVSNKTSRFHIPVTAPVPFTSGRGNVRPIHPYVLGVLLGDGCLRKATPEFCSADAEIVSRVEDKLGRKVTKSVCDRTAPTYRLSGMPEIKAYLVRSKLYGKLSQDKHIPKQYLYSSIEDRLELARGLMDTDGWAGSVNADAAAFFGTSSKRLAEDAAWLFRSLGAVVSIHEKEKFYTHKGERKQGLNSYTLRIRHPNASDLFSLPRKQEKCAAPRYMTRSIVSITPGRKAEAQCITVSHPSSLYLTNDFIVTHNSALAWQSFFEVAGKHTVAGNSGEMPREQIIMREKARRTGISTNRQKSGKVSDREMEELVMAGIEMKRLKIAEINCQRLTLDQLDHRIGRLINEKGIEAYFLDHIGKLAWTGKMEHEDEFKQGQKATSMLKDMAMKHGIPIIALTHLKKSAFQEYNGRSFKERLNTALYRRPTYRDLVGSMDKDADHVILPFQARPIIAGMEPEEGSPDHALWQAAMDQVSGKAELILSLSREREFPKRREVEWCGATTSFGPSFKTEQNSRGLF